MRNGAAFDPGADAVAGLRRIMLNALSLLLAYVLPRVLTIGAVILAARVLGASRFGEYGTAAAYAVLLSIVATLGMQPLLIREMARTPERSASWMRAAHTVKTASSLLMLALLVGLGRYVLGYHGQVLGAAVLLGVAYAVGAYAENLAAWFQATERMGVWMQASAWYGLVTGVAGAALVWTTRSVLWFCAAPVLGQLASVAWLALRAPAGVRGGRPGAGPTGPMVATLLRSMIPFAAGFVALTAHSKIDVLLLAHWWPAAEVGIYTAAHKFVDVIQALAVVAAAAVYPRLSRVGRGGSAAARLMELTVLAGVLAGGALWLARIAVVPLLFGAGWDAAIPVTALLALAIPALAINIVGGYVLAATGEMATVARIYGAALVVKLVLNVALVPAGGAGGTATAMLATELLLAGAMLLALHSRAAALPGARPLRAAFLAGAIWGGLALVRDPTGGLGTAALFLAASVAVYALAGGVPKDDRAMFVAAFRGVTGGGQ